MGSREALILRAAAAIDHRTAEESGNLGVDLTASTLLVASCGAEFTARSRDDAGEIGCSALDAAVRSMTRAGRSRVLTLITILVAGGIAPLVLPPCRRCREVIHDLHPANIICDVVLGPAESVPLGDLLPRHSRSFATLVEESSRTGPR